MTMRERSTFEGTALGAGAATGSPGKGALIVGGALGGLGGATTGGAIQEQGQQQDRATATD